MSYPGIITFNTSGRQWRRLKAELEAKLSARIRLSRIRAGRLICDNLNALICMEILTIIHEIEMDYGPDTVIREITIAQAPYINIRIRRPKRERRISILEHLVKIS